MAEYHFPPIDLLKDSSESSKFQRLEYVQHLRDCLSEMFESFNIKAKVVDFHYNNFAILLKVKLGQGMLAPAVVKLRADIELHLGNPVEFLYSEEDATSLTIAVKNPAGWISSETLSPLCLPSPESE